MFRLANLVACIATIVGLASHVLAWLEDLNGWQHTIQTKSAEDIFSTIIFTFILLIPSYGIIFTAIFAFKSLPSCCFACLGAIAIACVSVDMWLSDAVGSAHGWDLILYPVAIQLPIALVAFFISMAFRVKNNSEAII
jgi:hypothetical protein